MGLFLFCRGDRSMSSTHEATVKICAILSPRPEAQIQTSNATCPSNKIMSQQQGFFIKTCRSHEGNCHCNRSLRPVSANCRCKLSPGVSLPWGSWEVIDILIITGKLTINFTVTWPPLSSLQKISVNHTRSYLIWKCSILPRVNTFHVSHVRHGHVWLTEIFCKPFWGVLI